LVEPWLHLAYSKGAPRFFNNLRGIQGQYFNHERKNNILEPQENKMQLTFFACPTGKYLLKGGFFLDFFYVRYSALIHLPPLRFHCVGGCWNRTQENITQQLFDVGTIPYPPPPPNKVFKLKSKIPRKKAKIKRNN
jgi:hypothetical protein